MTQSSSVNNDLTSAGRVLLVDPQQSYTRLLRSALLDHQYEILNVLQDIERMVDRCIEQQPDALVLAMTEPDCRCIDQLKRLKNEYPVPVVVFSEIDSPEVIDHVIEAGVSAFVVDDVQPQRIKSIITVAVARFRQQQGLISELAQAKGKLEERKLIDRAKGLLMSAQGLSEDEAYSSMRKMAMDKGLTMKKVAHSVIDVMSLLNAKPEKAAAPR